MLQKELHSIHMLTLTPRHLEQTIPPPLQRNNALLEKAVQLASVLGDANHGGLVAGLAEAHATDFTVDTVELGVDGGDGGGGREGLGGKVGGDGGELEAAERGDDEGGELGGTRVELIELVSRPDAARDFGIWLVGGRHDGM